MKRRKAREYALQFLYRIDFVRENKKQLNDNGFRGELDVFWADAREEDPDVREFAEDIISDAIENLEDIDLAIQQTAEKWKISRMANIDRNILRVAVCELLYRKDIPVAVTINEALEIAKKYSSAESASFINGILDRIAKEYSQKG